MSERLNRVIAVPREHPKLVREGRLRIILDHITDLKARGIYGPHDDLVPDRYLGLHPDAAAALRRIESAFPGVFHYSDIFRNATGSKGRREKNKVRKGYYTGKLPGSSAHGYGLCLDHDLDRNLRRLAKFMHAAHVDKEEYDEIWRNEGWWCHRDGPRGDHRRGHEDWHFNYFGDDPERWLAHCHGRSTAPGVEAKVQYLYGPFTLDAEGIHDHLERLGYDPNGGGHKAAIYKFQQDWTLSADGIAGPQTQRVLLFVGAELVDLNGAPLPLTFP